MKLSSRGLKFAACIIAFALSVGLAFAGNPNFHVLTVFKGVSNGGQPWATPVADKAGNLYGTTSLGGNGSCSDGHLTFGCGTVYELSPPVNGGSWTETLLYQFQSDADGDYPVGALVFDNAGNLYGTTEYGGSGSAGTVFKLSPPSSGSGPWTKTTLYNFAGGSAGAYPQSGLIFDASGNLYGTTYWAGNCNNGCGGVVYELSPPSSGTGAWTETVIYTFQNSPDGASPEGTLVLSGGNLYGTTILGGADTYCESGCGIIFELSPPASPGGTWTETILHSFDTISGDGQTPRSGMVLGKNGIFYGVTEFGGSKGVGTVYQLVPPSSPGGNWVETVLYNFPGDPEGIDAFATPAIGPDGSLYGTTMFGGSNEWGNVFRLTPPSSPGNPWTETEIVDFDRVSYPIAGVIFGEDGWLYGATLGGPTNENCAFGSSGQAFLCGELFRVQP